MERYKVLGAMLALGQFTTKDIVNRTNVKSATVSGIIQRDKDLLEEIPFNSEAKRKGGQFRILKIRDDKMKDVEKMLKDFFRSTRGATGVSVAPSVIVPVELRTAMSTLRRWKDSHGIEEKKHLLRLASLDFQRGRYKAESLIPQVDNPDAIRELGAVLRQTEAHINLRKADLATSQKNQKEAALYLDKAASYFEYDNRPVFLIDGIAYKQETFTDQLFNILKSHGIDAEKQDWAKTQSLLQLSSWSRLNKYGSCVLTIKSKGDSKEKEATEQMCRTVLSQFSLDKRLIVCDENTSGHFKQIVKERENAFYFPNAIEKHRDSILKLVAF